MTRHRSMAGLVAVVTAAVLLGSAGASAASPGGPAGGPAGGPPGKKPAVESEARKVDRVPTPAPTWFDCTSIFGTVNDCTTVHLPLDYDDPKGPTTSVAVLRHKATDQAHKLGSLFVNPGGPGGSAVETAAWAEYFLGADVLARFDIIGMDPRGTNYSDNVRCWANAGEQAAVQAGANVYFPFTAAETAAYITAAESLGRACSTTGARLSGSMSTAEVARDMDVVRRMVGDPQLTYLGFSYGSYLGNVYANMFPDRVRALAIDGVLDPTGWAGTPATSSVPMSVRIASGDGSARAMDEILARCAAAGAARCRLAATGDPAQQYAEDVAALKNGPLELTIPGSAAPFSFSYAVMTTLLLGDMYGPEGSARVDAVLSAVHVLIQPPAEPGTPAAQERAAAMDALVAELTGTLLASTSAHQDTATHRAAWGLDTSYVNRVEATESVMCTDGLNPADTNLWPGFADAADRTGHDFGRWWAWWSAPCASTTWTVRDEDAYRGTFDHTTAHPVLVVGNYWDPATRYEGAVRAASLLPGSVLLSSDSWGHTAYGTSECVTGAVDRYLIDGTTPAAGTVCVGDVQPFTATADPTAGTQSRLRAVAPHGLPPVTVQPFESLAQVSQG